jgi:ABC-type oligopeptide transport system substrate-binding subunit
MSRHRTGQQAVSYWCHQLKGGMEMRRFKIGALFITVVMFMTLGAVSSALAEDKPQYGGIMRVAIAGDPPSLDMHQESTFKVFIPMSNCYNGLIVYDPHGYPNIIGDLAKSWTSSRDGMTWTFTLHQGVKFHDGSEMTSADSRPAGIALCFPRVRSARVGASIGRSRASKRPIATRSSFASNILRRRS